MLSLLVLLVAFALLVWAAFSPARTLQLAAGAAAALVLYLMLPALLPGPGGRP